MTSGPEQRRQRQPRADGERTRSAILRAAASLATVEGLDGLSIGDLAAATGMSKSGLYAHFGSKEELQLAIVDEAERIFRAEVVEPTRSARPGLEQLAATCEAYLGYVQRRVFPGGCFFAATALEMGMRPGPVRDRIATVWRDFTGLLSATASIAIEQHEISADEDPDRLAFELHGILLAADTRFVLDDDPAPLDLAWEIIGRRLGLTSITRTRRDPRAGGEPAGKARTTTAGRAKRAR